MLPRCLRTASQRWTAPAPSSSSSSFPPARRPTWAPRKARKPASTSAPESRSPTPRRAPYSAKRWGMAVAVVPFFLAAAAEADSPLDAATRSRRRHRRSLPPLIRRPSSLAWQRHSAPGRSWDMLAAAAAAVVDVVATAEEANGWIFEQTSEAGFAASWTRDEAA